MKTAGLYIHVPFCRHKCFYCDFYSAGVRIAEWDLYVESLVYELSLRIESEGYIYKPKTLYFGGGTPSLIPTNHLKKLVEKLDKLVDLSHCHEITIEANPEDITEENCRIWKDIGINRISLGVQSLNDTELTTIGRYHSSGDALKAIELLKSYFSNVSVDLMYGLPGQTFLSLGNTLDRILNLSPQHISIYSLTLEEGTAMYVIVGSGKLTLPDEDVWKEMTDLISAKLTEKGYLHYEISNYALSGFESIHNSGYWNGHPYMGLGPGAHSYDGEKTRRFNPTDLKGYLKWGSRKESKDFFEFEILSDEELMEESIMTQLRTLQGLDLNEFYGKFGESRTLKLNNQAENFINKGLLKREGSRIFLTESGIPVSDNIILSLI